MDKRKIILTILGVVLIIGAIFGAKLIIDSKEQPKPTPKKTVKTVFVDTAQNSTISINIPANGNLVAKRRVELYAEVQGVFRYSSHSFRSGQAYKRGQTLLKIDAAEYAASVQSAKSDLYNQITAIMPDLRMDYPEIFPKWQEYLNNFDVNSSVSPLPEPSNDRERYFINGRGVNTAYFNIKNLEQRLVKYHITAPYDGVLTEALVTEGTLIRNGQKLGEFIDPDVYELQVSIAKQYADLLKVDENVSLTTNTGERTYTGKVSRINAKIDQATQTVNVFIEVKDGTLKEGMYMQANLDAKQEENAIEIDRSLVNDRNEIFTVNDSILQSIEVNPVYFSDKKAVIKGVPDGAVILSRQVSGAYNGMRVNIAESDNTETGNNTPQNSESISQ
ncbi:efflux RND transporter periplasmic adaptor subunit [Christiangramia sp. SM2212]|uniref:HlyD family efflux transporter periplasmic adaptor subunit n=1 Tax=Christiangramia sediminicola TaxID=3073267 RepID=A0ABU1ETA7_9FLAO|nr:HlyD family efflux transporter periplasmic adaptor subunit [Christiangramia sp. SM2212]MDR5591633.1 HlyD family efflux transporter periplasmic adaptor subunit [Christiangramia sp. SM2212]